MLTLLIGTDWVAVRDEILSRIASDVAAQQGGRILMVPELISHDTERRLCAAAGDTASRFAEVLSFSRLVSRVSDYTGESCGACLDNGGRVVAMAAAARLLHSRLKAYAAVETKPEFLTELVDAVDEFKRCCITPVDLQSASENSQGTLAQKLEELSLLLSAYDSLCAQGKRDPRDQINWLLEKLQDCDFGQNHVFYIDGFPDFTRQHMAVLQQLIMTSSHVTVGINCDTVDSKALAFEKAADTASQLIKCAKQACIEVNIETVADERGTISSVCRSLFQGRLPENTQNLHVFTAENPAQEVQKVAHRIMALVRDGCRFRDIGVVCADMAGYDDYIRLHFHRCGIPVYQSGTEDILQNPVIATVISALDAAIGGLEQADVVRYLKSILSKLDSDTCDLVENYAVIWGIRGNRWKDTWTEHPDGLGEMPTEESNSRLAAINSAKELALVELFKLQENFKSAIRLSEQVEALLAFLRRVDLSGRLSMLADEMDAQGDNRSAQILNQLWEILLKALEQMHGVLGETAWEPEAFKRLLILLLSQYDVGTIPPVLDAVNVGGISAMRCQQVKHLFVLGAEEGALPGYAGSAGLLSDQERTALRDLGLPLTGGAMEGIQAEFAEIYGVFCGARESITVSCSGAQPSYVYSRLAKMAHKEQNLEEIIGSAEFNPYDASAYLAKFDASMQAETLGILDSFEDVQTKKNHSLGSVEKAHISSLYGDRLNLSASQIDRQAECRLSYFLKYGIRAKERKEITVDPAEFGTYVHAVLEQTAAKVMELGGFHEVSLEKTLEIAAQYSDNYIKEHFSAIDSVRLTYLFQRNSHELEMVVKELWQELKSGAFVPKDFELAFGEHGKMEAIDIPASGMNAILRGFVDRVDIWENNGQHYFRVVDYKTGRKDFDYCDVFNGVGLQMLLYLFALEQNGAEVVGSRAVAAGVQYFPARAPLLSADGRLDDEQAEALRQKQWKRSGLLLNDESVLEAMDPDEAMPRLCCTRKRDGSVSGDLADREQLKLLRKYVFSLLGSMVDDIASGNVTPNPYTRGASHNACTYCPYTGICHADTVEGRRNYKAMDAAAFWEGISKEVNGHG